jgi:hypothetical protein
VFVGSIVVDGTGAVAWIMTNYSILANRRVRRVIEAMGSHTCVLASGVKIAPRSLRLHRSTLTWTAAGKRYSAKLG